jgi:hypothetical protein
LTSTESVGGAQAPGRGSWTSSARVRPGYERLFGRTFWDDVTEHPHLGTTFDALMSAGHGDPDRIPPLDGGWTAVRAVVDVGGGPGHVLANLLAANPRLQGTLVDLPTTAERAHAALTARGVADRHHRGPKLLRPASTRRRRASAEERAQ